MPAPIRNLLAGVRSRLGRSMRSAGAWVEGGDPAALAGRLGRGEIVWRAFIDAGAAMRACGRFDEADRMLARGLGAFPDDPTLLYELALSAHNAGRYAVAVERWEKAMRFAAALSPERAAMCRCGLAANTRVLGQLDRARAVIAEARRLYPDDLVVLSEAARIAEVGAELDEALALWRRALAAPSPQAEWAQGEVAVLVRLGRLDEAEQALAVHRGRFTQPPGLLGAEGLIASARGDWPRAVAIWTAYLEHFPGDRGGRDQLAAAAVSSQLAAGATAGPSARSPADADVLRRCEGIGEGCEFALVQQRCGVEADGLLSWGSVTLDALVPLLERRFEGIGEPENSHLVVGPDGGILVRDRRWPLDIRVAPPTGRHARLAPSTGRHAPLASPAERDAAPGPGEAEAAGQLAQACRRITDRRRRLLADLAAAEKLFVFRSDSLDGDGLERLHRALSAYGSVRLLGVQPAAPTAPSLLQGRAGEVIKVDRHRFVGFLERTGTPERQGGPGRVEDAPADADWVALCRGALGFA